MLRSATIVGVGVGERVELLDHASLLGDEHATVAREADDGRVSEAAEGDGLLKAGGHDDGARRRGAVGRGRTKHRNGCDACDER